MLAFELRKNASDVDAKIMSVKEELQQLVQRRDSISPNTPLAEIGMIIDEIKTREVRLEKLQLLRMAIQKKLNEYANNASKAKPLIEKVLSAHDQRRSLIDSLINPQKEVASIVKKLHQVNSTVSTACAKAAATSSSWTYCERGS